MNEVQSTPTNQNQQLGSTTSNPQAPGGQNLNSTGGGVQNPSNVVDDSENLSITSVSNGISSTPINIESTTTTSTSTPPNDSSNAKTIGVIGVSILVIVAIFFVTWFMSRKGKEY